MQSSTLVLYGSGFLMLAGAAIIYTRSLLGASASQIIRRASSSTRIFSSGILTFCGIAIVISLILGYAYLISIIIGLVAGIITAYLGSFSFRSDEPIQNAADLAHLAAKNFPLNIGKIITIAALDVLMLTMEWQFFGNTTLLVAAVIADIGILFMTAHGLAAEPAVFPANNASDENNAERHTYNAFLIGAGALLAGALAIIEISVTLSPENAGLFLAPLAMILIVSIIAGIGSFFLTIKKPHFPQRDFYRWFLFISMITAVVALALASWLWNGTNYSGMAIFFSVASGIIIAWLFIYVANFSLEGNVSRTYPQALSSIHIPPYLATLFLAMMRGVAGVILTFIVMAGDFILNFKIGALYNVSLSLFTAILFLALFFANHLPHIPATEKMGKEWRNEMGPANQKISRQTFINSYVQAVALMCAGFMLVIFVFLTIGGLGLVHYTSFWQFYLFGLIIGILFILAALAVELGEAVTTLIKNIGRTRIAITMNFLPLLLFMVISGVALFAASFDPYIPASIIVGSTMTSFLFLLGIILISANNRLATDAVKQAVAEYNAKNTDSPASAPPDALQAERDAQEELTTAFISISMRLNAALMVFLAVLIIANAFLTNL